jgi:hypothetical protein
MKNWKLLAEALGVPDSDRIIPSLESLDAEFRRLRGELPQDMDPAVVFSAETPEVE